MSETDLISNLPDHLLCSIISYLPTKQAIATSIFSKRWKFLWKFLSRLSFDQVQSISLSDMDEISSQNQVQSISSVVDKILSSQIRNSIDFFHMHHVPEDWNSTSNNNIQHWIEHLKNEKNLQGVSLLYHHPNISDIYDDENYYFSYSSLEIKIPRSIFHGRFLQVVELDQYVFNEASPFEGCVNVKTLKLIAVYLDSETLKGIVHNCSSLEDLSLISPCTKLNIDIQHNKLKIVKIKDVDIIMKFTLVSESLTELVFQPSSYSSEVSHIDCPNLRVVQTDNNDLLEWGTGLRPYRDYKRYKDGIPFIGLRVLCTSLDLNNMSDHIVLSYVFRKWSHLQTLDITNQADKTRDSKAVLPQEHWFWENKELADCFTYHLRLVRVRGFTGKERELRFVIHIIKNASVLEKLEIQCSDGCLTLGAVATRGLLSVPRASVNVSIVLNNLPRD